MKIKLVIGIVFITLLVSACVSNPTEKKVCWKEVEPPNPKPENWVDFFKPTPCPK